MKNSVKHQIKSVTLLVAVAFIYIAQANAQKSTDNLSMLISKKMIVVESIMNTVEEKVIEVYTNAFMDEALVDESLQLEEWMVNSDSWIQINADVVIEAELELEPWMLDFDNEIEKVEQVEPEVELEEWMYSLGHWNL